ncbi:MAG: CD1247 N-terminal domain-containing protein [Faecousia sp.]
MTISEKSAYLKGLMEGLKLSTESDEGKMIAAMVDLLGDMARKITDIEDTTIAISDELDEIEEDLDAIEDFIMDEDEDDDDFYDDYEDDEDDEDWDGEDEEFEEGFDFGDEDSTIYEVECACGNIIDFDEETLEKGSIVCPNCGETLEFSVDDVEE